MCARPAHVPLPSWCEPVYEVSNSLSPNLQRRNCTSAPLTHFPLSNFLLLALLYQTTLRPSDRVLLTIPFQIKGLTGVRQ